MIKLTEQSQISGRLRVADAACSNHRYQAYEASECIPPSQGYETWDCSIHGNHIIVSMLCAMVGMSLISGMYSAALLLRTGGYFLRLVLAVHAAVAELATPMAEPAQDHELHLARAFLKMTRNYDGDESQGKLDEELLAVFNSGFGAWANGKLFCGSYLVVSWLLFCCFVALI
jgi:hypothetical protein